MHYVTFFFNVGLKPSDRLLSKDTIPYQMCREIEESISESCIATHAWKRIEGR